MDKNIAFALYCGDGRVELAFERLEEAFFTNYSSDIHYGVIIDPEPSAVFKSVTDSVLAEKARHGVERLSRLYGKRFFSMLRERKYNAVALRNGYYRYACEGGMYGAFRDLFCSFKGDISAFSVIFGEAGFNGSALILDHSMWDTADVSLRCDFLKYIFRADLTRAVKVKNPKCCAFFEKNEYFFTLKAESFFTVKEKFTPYIPTSEEVFLLKSAACSASKSFFKIYDGKMPLPETVFELSLMLCAVASMRMFRCFGESESLELADRIVRKLKTIIALSGDFGVNGDVLLLLCAAGEGLCEVMTESEFILLKSEIFEIKSMLTKMYKSHFGGEISGAICCKELESQGFKMGKIAQKLLFSLSAGEFSELLEGKIGREDVMYNAELLISAAQMSFGAPFRNFLYKNKEFKARSGLLNNVKPLLETVACNLQEYPILTSTQAAGELLDRFEGVRGVKKRLISSGVSKSELPYIAYLEGCIKKQAEREEKSVCFACDGVGELVFSLARASVAIPSLHFTVITPDRYGAKKLLSVSPFIKIFPNASATELKLVAKESGFFRQLTPYSTLSELLNEIKI